MSVSSDEATRLRRLLVAVVVLTRLIPAVLLPGTEDVSLFLGIARAVAWGQNPYRTVPINWPPLWPAMVLLSHHVTELTGIAFHVTMKAWPIVADVLITLVLFSSVSAASDAKSGFRRALLYAANPISIFVTGVHGQFDTIPALCTLLAVVFATAGDAGVSAAWTGIGGLAKTWPLFTLPAFVSPAAIRRSVRYAAIALAPAVVTMAIVYAVEPAGVTRQVIHYRGAPGWWGLTGIAFLGGGEASAAQPVFGLALYAGWLLTAIVLWTRNDPPASKVLSLLLAFLVFTPGFGIQYLVWLVPVGLLVDARRTFLYSSIAGAVALFEIVMRPHTGIFGETLVNLPTRVYLDAYGQLRDRAFCIVDRIPVWAFCCYWWGALVLRPLFARPRASVEHAT